jgi:hypothetical protein
MTFEFVGELRSAVSETVNVLIILNADIQKLQALFSVTWLLFAKLARSTLRAINLLH